MNAKIAGMITEWQNRLSCALAVSVFNPRIEKQEKRLLSVAYSARDQKLFKQRSEACVSFFADQLMSTAISSAKKSGNKYSIN